MWYTGVTPSEDNLLDVHAVDTEKKDNDHGRYTTAIILRGDAPNLSKQLRAFSVAYQFQ